MATAHLERDTQNKMFAGVAAGLAHYLDVDVALVRTAFVLLAIAGGIGVIAYIALLIFMPEAPASGEPPAYSSPKTVPEDDAHIASRRRQIIGIALVAVGAVLLLANLGAFDWVRWDVLWPLLIIAVGVALIARQMRRR